MDEMDCNDVFKVCLNIPFPTVREAAIAYDVLRVDAEPRRSGVSKKLVLDRNIFKVEFAAEEARQVRVAVHSFMEFLILVSQTMDQFGPPRSDTYGPEISIKAQA
ncbi:EKC/KEOPS complex subunit LAGE3 [Ischnura elegans]|uniref:EKC/KEOPS complex subunit LAGE3 n=1 Tax=Ischnura elegans TaxID=197161 RepID=UPI001ED8712C|nr:EKC/KEOPS complex subunit LAGE3 [Ischnura elegans]